MAQFPDLLSAPAPVLRNQDLLLDDETVVFAPPQQVYRPPVRNSDCSSTVASYESDSHSPALSPASVSSSSSYGSVSTQGAMQTYSPQNKHACDSPTENAVALSSLPFNDYQRNRLAEYDPYSENPCPKSGAIIPHVSYDMSSKISQRPPEVSKMRTRRKVATATAGVCGGLIGLAVLGPVGAVAGGVGGAMLTKKVGKRMERKKTERIAAQRHAAEERQFGREIQAYGSEFL